MNASDIAILRAAVVENYAAYEAAMQALAEAHGPRIGYLAAALLELFDSNEVRRWLLCISGMSASLPSANASARDVARAAAVALADAEVQSSIIIKSLLEERPKREAYIRKCLATWDVRTPAVSFAILRRAYHHAWQVYRASKRVMPTAKPETLSGRRLAAPLHFTMVRLTYTYASIADCVRALSGRQLRSKPLRVLTFRRCRGAP